MAFEIRGFVDGTRKAGTSMTDWQYHFVKLGTGNTVAKVSNAANRPYGILLNDPVSGDAAEVGCAGVYQAVAGEAIGEGARFGIDASGRVVATSSGNDWGFTLQAAGAAGEIISVQIGCM